MTAIPAITANHLVMGEDLNHHGTLYAGRAAQWFMESGLMAASACVPARNVVCARMHGMSFASPVELGETVEFTAKAVLSGTSSITTYISVRASGRPITDGFITFANVDADSHPFPHGLKIEATTPEDRKLQDLAREIKASSV